MVVCDEKPFDRTEFCPSVVNGGNLYGSSQVRTKMTDSHSHNQQQHLSRPTGSSPFQPHVGPAVNTLLLLPSSSGGGTPSKRNGSPSKAAMGGNLAELQDLLKAGKSKEGKRRHASVRYAILQLFPSQVKTFVRENDWSPTNSIRTQLWLELCRHHSTDGMASEGFYSETVDQVFGRNQILLAVMKSRTLGQCVKEIEERPEECAHLPSFVDQANVLSYFLTEKGSLAARRVICVLGYTHPDITYCPGLYPLTSLFLHYMSEEDAYNSLCTLVRSRQGKFLHQTKLGYEAAWRTVYTLTKKHAKAAFAHLGKFVKTSDQVERLFESWYWWIFRYLPFTHLVRVVDCYLYEGKKVLYRVAMALVMLFAKQSAKMDSLLSQEALNFGLRQAIQTFCQDIPVSPSKLLKIAFGIRSLSQKNINNILLRIEMGLKSRSLISGPATIRRSFSSEGMPTSQSQINIHTSSHTLTVRERRLSKGARCLSVGVIPFSNFQSQTITTSQLLTLWSWLPTRITMYQPELVYTTEEHGCSLLTFYTRVQNYEPTLLIIKTTNDEIFGAYCSTRWAEKNTKGETGQKRTYFGTGETFLFTIYPEMRKFPWVGLNHRDGNESAALKHSSELFMAADSEMLTIGGGNGQAIWIDENIRYGGTSHCDTFDNPPLCDSQNFECKVVEVIGFK